MTQPALVPPDFVLTEAEFERVRALLYQHSRIALAKGKEGLVRTRLSRHLRRLELATFTEYLDHVKRDQTGQELSDLIDTLTTNRTNFFRESAHFDFLRATILPPLLAQRRPIRIWSAGCSTGEEPYTLAMLVADLAPDFADRDIRILATDLSARVLVHAKTAEYPLTVLDDIPIALRHRFVNVVTGPDKRQFFRIPSELRTLVSFARLNLMDDWPMQRSFDIIFCRNVMIYFDRETQQRLVERFWEHTTAGGHFFVGHSESLTPLRHSFRGLRPAVYIK